MATEVRTGVVVEDEAQMSAARMVPIGDGRRRRMQQVGLIEECSAHHAEVRQRREAEVEIIACRDSDIQDLPVKEEREDGELLVTSIALAVVIVEHLPPKSGKGRREEVVLCECVCGGGRGLREG